MSKPKACAKEAILRIFEEQGMTRLDELSLRRLHTLVQGALPELRIARSYVIRVIAGAGKPVAVRDPFAGADLREPYRTELENLLKYDTLDNAEGCLHALSDKMAGYRSREDREGVESVRSIALLGKRRALAAARRARSEEAKTIKSEIAEWFTLWLYDPSSFFDWLSLRKSSPEYSQNFPMQRPDVLNEAEESGDYTGSGSRSAEIGGRSRDRRTTGERSIEEC